MGKSKLEFYAKITTSDGREITKRVAEDIPDDLNLENLDEFMSTFDDYGRDTNLSPVTFESRRSLLVEIVSRHTLSASQRAS
jgi:hypothetical protein